MRMANLRGLMQRPEGTLLIYSFRRLGSGDMKIIGVNNMEPGNQGVTVYFDGADILHIVDGLRLLHEDMKHRSYPKVDDADEVPDEAFRAFLQGQVDTLHDEFVYLNEYLDSINPNLEGEQ